MAARRHSRHPILHPTVEVRPLAGSLPGTFVPVVERIKGPADLLGSGDCTLEFMGETFELEAEGGWFYPKGGSPREILVVPDPDDPSTVLVITVEPVAGVLAQYGVLAWTLESQFDWLSQPLFDVKDHVLKVELFRDEACTKPLDDWPAEGGNPWSAKYLISEENNLYVQVTARSGYGDYFIVNVGTESSPDAATMQLHEVVPGRYRNTSADDSGLLRLGEDAGFVPPSPHIHWVKVMDEELLSVRARKIGSMTELCSRNIMVDRAEFAAGSGEWPKYDPLGAQQAYLDTTAQTFADEAGDAGFFNNGLQKGDNLTLSLCEKAQDGNHTEADILFITGEEGLVVDVEDSQTFGTFSSITWDDDIEFVAIWSCHVFGYLNSEEFDEDEWVSEWVSSIAARKTHIVLGTVSSVRVTGNDEVEDFFKYALDEDQTVINAWKNACLEGIDEEYAILARTANIADKLKGPITRDSTSTAFTYYYYEGPDGGDDCGLPDAGPLVAQTSNALSSTHSDALAATRILPVFTSSTTVVYRCDITSVTNVQRTDSLDESGARDLALHLAGERLHLDGMDTPRVARMMKATFDATDIRRTWQPDVESHAVEIRHVLSGVPLDGDEATLIMSPNGSCACRVRWTQGIRQSRVVHCISAAEAVVSAKARGLIDTALPTGPIEHAASLRYRSSVLPDGRTEIRPHWMLKISGRPNVHVDAVQP